MCLAEKLTFWGTITRHGTTTLRVGLMPVYLVPTAPGNRFTFLHSANQGTQDDPADYATVITPASVRMSTHVEQQLTFLLDQAPSDIFI